MNIETAVRKACELRGGQAALARELGVQAAFVFQWKTGVRPVPVDKVLEIERITKKQVTGESLRPDLNWAYWRAAALRKPKAA